ncbi:MAG: methyl-accepting chemotaxis protein [Glaciecola sp.]
MALKKVAKPALTNDFSMNNDVRAKREADEQRRRARTMAKQQQAAERIAAATIELSSGITEASAARDQLSGAVIEIAAGAEQSSGASQESLAAMSQITQRVKRQEEVAHESKAQSLTLQNLIEEMSQDIGQLVRNIEQSSLRQSESVTRVNELGQQALKIDEAVKQVMRIADQTNLLALNAAIEAGRAGKHGKGFAVVADTVRALAETSEKNASDIAKQIEAIREKSEALSETVTISANSALEESEKGKGITKQLRAMKTDMTDIYTGAVTLGKRAEEMNQAALEAQKGSESIASAAEEQSAAVEQVVKSLDQQEQALTGSEAASQALELITDDLKNSTDISKSSEEVAASAEELSASVEEINRSSTEIMTAIGQISLGADQASTAVEQAVTGITQIEKSVEEANTLASNSVEKGNAMVELLAENQTQVREIIQSINDTVETGRSNLESIEEIENLARQIDKVVEAIGVVAIKTAMLAVNGAVEAARAGEFGKGFAVVSDDIQNLADDAAENVDQIKDMIKSIQAQTIRVRDDLTGVSNASLEETTRAKKTTADLTTVAEKMRQVIASNHEVNEGSEEISTAVAQAKLGMEQIAAANEEASHNTTQASTAAKQQSQGAEELAAAIEEIASIADELQSV